MPTSEDLYDNLPDAFKDIFGGVPKQPTEKKETDLYKSMKETLEKIKAINKSQ